GLGRLLLSDCADVCTAKILKLRQSPPMIAIRFCMSHSLPKYFYLRTNHSTQFAAATQLVCARLLCHCRHAGAYAGHQSPVTSNQSPVTSHAAPPPLNFPIPTNLIRLETRFTFL